MSRLEQYAVKNATVFAVRWHRNGDHPGEGRPDREGAVVGYFRSYAPDLAGHVPCTVCGERYHDHGVLFDGVNGDTLVHPGDWIVHGPAGPFTVRHGDFADRYEAVVGGDGTEG